jgi:hypothetical protein
MMDDGHNSSPLQFRCMLDDGHNSSSLITTVALHAGWWTKHSSSLITAVALHAG